VAGAIRQPITVEGKAWDAPATFAESLRISEESKMEGERARTLTAWARYEQGRGETARGATLLEEARAIFQRIGAALEAERLV
jgi:hypothetical protein